MTQETWLMKIYGTHSYCKNLRMGELWIIVTSSIRLGVSTLAVQFLDFKVSDYACTSLTAAFFCALLKNTASPVISLQVLPRNVLSKLVELFFL